MDVELTTSDIIKELEQVHSFELYYAKTNKQLRKHCNTWETLYSNKLQEDTPINDNFIENYRVL